MNLVAHGVQRSEREREPTSTDRPDKQGAQDRELGGVGEFAQSEVPTAETRTQVGYGREGEDQRRGGQPLRRRHCGE